jgi:hypothetical protein
MSHLNPQGERWDEGDIGTLRYGYLTNVPAEKVWNSCCQVFIPLFIPWF